MSDPVAPTPRKHFAHFSPRLKQKSIWLLVLLISTPVVLLVSSFLLAVALSQRSVAGEVTLNQIIQNPILWVGFLIALMSAAAILWLFIQAVIIPVITLSTQVKKLANGDWSQKFSVQGNDELGLLAYSLNQIRNELGLMYRKIERQALHNSTNPEFGLAESGLISMPEDHSPGLGDGLHRELLFEPIEFDRQEENVLYAAAQKISQAADEGEINRIIEDTFTKVGYACAGFDVYPDMLRLVNLVDRQGRISDKSLKGVSLQTRNLPAMLQDKEVIILDDQPGTKDLDDLYAFFEGRKCSSVAIFPLFLNRKIVRIIALGSRKPTPLSAQNMQPFLHLSQTLNATTQRLAEIRSLQNQMKAYESLASLSQAVSAESNLRALYQLVHEKITTQIGKDLSFSIAIYDDRKKQIFFPYHYEDNKTTSIDPFPLGEGLTSYIIQNRSSLLLPLKFEPDSLPTTWNTYQYLNAVSDVERDAIRLGAKIVGKPAKSWLGVPLLLGGVVIGAMIVQDTVKEDRFNDKDQTMLETIAPQIAIAIRNAQLIEDMTATLQAYDLEHTLLSTLMENVPEKIYFKDIDGRYLRVSNSYLASMGFASTQDILGYTDEELLTGEMGQLRHQPDAQVISSGIAVVGQMIEHTADNGDKTWELTSRVPLSVPGDDANSQPYALLVISQDITNLMKVEALSRRQNQQLLTAAEIARDVAGSLEASQILKNATDLIRARFGYYHASVFIVEPTRKHAVLHEASGEIGNKMKTAGHRLAIGSRSLVGQAIARAQTVVSNNTRSNPDYYPNPLLPDTRAELVVPLKVGARVLGALDVQADQTEAFKTEDIHTLEILADQLAMAIENANLFARAQENLARHRLLHQITTAISTSENINEALERTVFSLRTTLGEERVTIYLADGNGNLNLRNATGYDNVDLALCNTRIGEGLIGMTAEKRHPIRINDTKLDTWFRLPIPETRSALAVPILYMDEILGVLCLESDQVERFNENDQEIIGALGDSLGAIITNAQLVDQIRKQVERQRMLFEITNKIRRSVDIETILRTSVTEISKAIGAQRASIHIAPPAHDPETPRPSDELSRASGEYGSHDNGHKPEEFVS
ncbi:MAG: GAF domain-containing protein [Chloroflexota bacterium]|jgi:GAF domain-containing protein/HAMP domain-containing protein